MMVRTVVCFIGILLGAALFALGVAAEAPLWFALGVLFTALAVLVGLRGAVAHSA